MTIVSDNGSSKKLKDEVAAVVVVVVVGEQEQVGGEGKTVRDMEQEQFDRLLQLFPVVRPRTYCVIFFLLFLFLSGSSFIVSFPVRNRCLCTRCRSIGSSLRTPAPAFLLRSQSVFVSSPQVSHRMVFKVPYVCVSFVLPFSF